MMSHEEILVKVVDEARKSKPEAGKTTPLVGAAAVLQDGSIHFAHRSEEAPGDHAEFTLLEKKLGPGILSGATIYATLEPCTKRGPKKVPCAERLIERRVKVVYIGMLDPNPEIRGHGVRMLRNAGIEVQFFPSLYGNQVEEMNRDFARAHDRPSGDDVSRLEIAKSLANRSLDEWYVAVNRLYWNRNFQKTPVEILAHLVEIVGALSHLASSKKKEGITASIYLPKAIAWWLTLCGKLGVKSVEAMVWAKFPCVCTYCMEQPHRDAMCREIKGKTPGVPWHQLKSIGGSHSKPGDLSGWQGMFDAIYPPQQTEQYGSTFARLSEELGELAEAVRVFPAEPGYFLCEAADVFAWIMHLANVHESVSDVNFSERHKALGIEMGLAYPDYCTDCRERLCRCAPILSSTIGRLAHEVPPEAGGYGVGGSFLTSSEIRKKFQSH